MSRTPPLGRCVLVAVAACLAATTAAAQAARPLPAPPPPQAPSKGDLVPVFETLTMDGKARKVDFPKGSKTVMLFFLSGCPHCHKMIPEWNRAYERRPKGLDVVGVIMDPDQAPASFWATTSIVFPVLRSPGREFLRGLNVNRAPLTLRVGEGGRIEDLALGEIDLIRLGELFAPVK
ncbi:MAG TPA: TlpA disulfide reductase family protein [Vicinamibacteria bacterium]|nr:TlpA disulfide reductase family protein [Vicinamibacteria bacterium]